MAQAWVKETIEPDQLNGEERLQEQTAQKRATSLQTSAFKVRGVLSEKAGHTCMNGRARILKTRLQEDTEQYLQQGKYRRLGNAEDKHHFYKPLFSGLIFKL